MLLQELLVGPLPTFLPVVKAGFEQERQQDNKNRRSNDRHQLTSIGTGVKALSCCPPFPGGKRQG